jgi:gamma-glutamyltranspeptidase / glutathione hydrolase
MGARPIIVARNGLVASGNPLASQAGLRILQDGGNAVDAAIAASAVSAVVRPFATGIGGDLFALVYNARDRQVFAVNASGGAPERASLDLFAERGLEVIPERGPLAIETPGCVAGWALAAERFGSRPLSALLAPAIDYAEDGFGASQALVAAVVLGRQTVGDQPGWASTFLPEGRAPQLGEMYRLPGLARSLKAIAEGGADEFYRGDLARRVATGVEQAGGVLSIGDLGQCRAELVEPISGSYRGYTVYEQPPVSQGFILLLQLAILDGFDVGRMGHLSADAVHHMVEAKKLALASRLKWFGDPGWMENPTAEVLSPAYVDRCRELIDPHRAAQRVELPVLAGAGANTTFLATADRDGNVVAMIQSVFSSWGSGVVAGDTGVLMTNRLAGFFLNPEHPNSLAPGKRTIHTLNSYLVFKDGVPFLAGGTPGVDDQVQVNLQVISAIVDHDVDLQDAVEAPRWSSTPGTAPWTRPLASPYGLRLEAPLAATIGAELASRGHMIESDPGFAVGSSKLIMVQPRSRSLLGAADPRREGYAVGW